MTVNVLGTQYTVEVKKYDDDTTFSEKSWSGYCSDYAKQIVICDMSTHKEFLDSTNLEQMACQKRTLRHEIVHAFLNESGLCDNSFSADMPWARSEEMVDWIAIQGQKIYSAWCEVDAL